MNRVTGGLYGRIRDSNTSARGPPSSPALITNLAPGRSGAESPENDADWQDIIESIRWYLGTARRTDTSEATNGERKSAAGRATETGLFDYVVWIPVAANIAISYIPWVGTVVGVYEAYGTLRDPNSSTSDRVFAIVAILPTGEILRILAHTKIVQAGIRAAEHVAGKAARGIGSLDDLSRAADALDRGGLSAAGRQLQKHGSRPGSAFPGARGNPSAINQQGQQIVDDILMTPGMTTVSRHHARFGDVTEIRAPDGRGLRYGSDGRFLGFLEPRP